MLYKHFLSFTLVVATFGQMPPKPPIIPLVDDIPFIKCDVCQKAAEVIFKSVRNKRDEVAPAKLSEDVILNIVEKSCNPDDSNYGEWITKLDIVESNYGLTLQKHTNIGRCREECKTIQRSCEETIGDIDTDIGEVLWRNDLSLSQFINNVCHSLSSACGKIKKTYRKGIRKDFKFIEMTEKDAEAAKLMKNMKGMPGMPGLEMYTPEDLENIREQLGLESHQPPTDPVEQRDEENSPMDSIRDGSYDDVSSPLGFFDTVKAMGSDILKKIKSLFGYVTKSEL